MKKTVKLSEKELNRLVKKIVNEQDDDINYEFIKADEYAGELKEDMEEYISNILLQVFESISLKDIVLEYQNKYKRKYPQYVDVEGYESDYIDLLLSITTDFEYDTLAYMLSNGLVDILIEKQYK